MINQLILQVSVPILSFPGSLSRATMSTSPRWKTRWVRWAPSRTSSSRCSTPPASTTPLQAPSTSRRTSTGTERPSGLIVVVDPLKYKTSNVRLMRKRDKSQVQIYKLFENLYKDQDFIFWGKYKIVFYSLKLELIWCRHVKHETVDLSRAYI